TRAAELLTELATKASPEDKKVLWSALRDEIGRHRAYPNAEWAMKEAELAPLAFLLDQLEPSDPVSRFSWLFNEYYPHMPRAETEERSFESVDNARADAIRHLLRTGGMEALIRLADTVALPEHVAVAAGEILGTAEEFMELI